MPMLQYFPGGSLDGGLVIVDRLYWHITWGATGGTWYVKAGEKVIFLAETQEAVEAFLYGLGLVCALLPDDTLDHLVFWVKREFAPEDITAGETTRYGDAGKR
jgi:hypothetical protein